MNRLTPALELKRADVDATGLFTGYASTFGGPPDSFGDIISKGAFRSALRRHEQNKTSPAMLWAHDHKEPIGKWLDLKEDDTGLLVTGQLTMGVRRGKEAHALLRDDAIALSIGFVIAKGGSTANGGIRQIRDIARLAEISLVSMPANSRAQVLPTNRKECEHLLRNAVGMSARQAKRAYSAAYVRNEQNTDLDRIYDATQEILETLRPR